MSAREYQERMTAATAAASEVLADLVSYDGEDCHNISTAIVEHIVEAATAATFLRLETEGAKRARQDAVDVLRPHLCGECLELLDPEPEEPEPPALVGEDDEVPGTTELFERTLFLGWAGRVNGLAESQATDGNPRMDLIEELHASIAVRHPLGIAESLYHAISALHAGDDWDAVQALEDLAQAELGAAMREKGAAALGALGVLVDPELNKERARELISDWTLEELIQVEQWAVVACKAATAEAVIPAKPAVVAQLERELGT